MMLTALGCNVAWGLVDAVMYLVATLTERGRNLTLLHRVRSAARPEDAHASIAEALPGRLTEAIGPGGLEHMRSRLTALPEPPARVRLHKDDYAGGVAWKTGLALAAVGGVLVTIIMALGG